MNKWLFPHFPENACRLLENAEKRMESQTYAHSKQRVTFPHFMVKCGKSHLLLTVCGRFTFMGHCSDYTTVSDTHNFMDPQRIHNKKDGYRQLNVRQLGSLRPWDHRGNVTWMDRKRIQCLSNDSQHEPIYLQQFLRYSEISVASDWFSMVLVSEWAFFNHILLFPGYASGTITVNVTWIEREFNACQTHHSMYTSIFDRLRAIARYWSEITTHLSSTVSEI